MTHDPSRKNPRPSISLLHSVIAGLVSGATRALIDWLIGT